MRYAGAAARSAYPRVLLSVAKKYPSRGSGYRVKSHHTDRCTTVTSMSLL